MLRPRRSGSACSPSHRVKNANKNPNTFRALITFQEIDKNTHPNHPIKMATIALIKDALLALKDRTGSSLPAIKKWIEANKKVSENRRSINKERQLACA